MAGRLTRLRDGATGPAVAAAPSGFPPAPAATAYFAPPPVPPPPPVPLATLVPPAPPILRYPSQEQPWATKADVERELETVREKARHALDLIGDEPPTCVNDVVARQERIINTLKEIVA